MGLISVELPWGANEVLEETPVSEVLFSGPVQSQEIIAAKVNSRLVGLDFKLEGPCRVEPVETDSVEGEEVARRTAALLFHSIARKLYPKLRLQVGQSLRGGYHYSISGNGVDLTEMAAALNQRFQQEAEAGRQIVRRDVSLEAAQALFAQTDPEKVRILRVWSNPRVPLVSCMDFVDIRYGPYALNSRCARRFRIEAFPPGLILVFEGQRGFSPSGAEGGSVLFRAYQETREWNDRIGVSTVSDLNDLCLKDQIKQVIKIAEGQHEKKIAQLADRISDPKQGIRVVCVAGPSSAGKTTFTKRLSIQLLVNGVNPQTLSLDDYYVDREKTPLDESGDLDFEALEAIDLPLFWEHLKLLVEGQPVRTPVYDFKTGLRRPESEWRQRRLDPHDVLVIEGIHGLNPALTQSVPDSLIFKIFINALTQLCIDSYNRIRTSDTRLLRRIVRDRLYRNYSAAETILRWPKVRAGEEKHIFPFQERCDAMFNSALAYEASVIKNFAQRYLLEIPPDSAAQARGHHLLRFLDLFVPVWPNDVPATSILREFIGGSGFSYK